MIFKSLGDLMIAQIPPVMVSEFWGDIEEGLEETIRNSHGECSMETIKKFVFGGKWNLMVASSSEIGYCGFAILEWVPTDRTLYLNIPFAWVGKNLRVLNEMFKVAEEIAEDRDATVKWISSNPSWSKFAERRGYKPRFTEYVKEVS